MSGPFVAGGKRKRLSDIFDDEAGHSSSSDDETASADEDVHQSDIDFVADDNSDNDSHASLFFQQQAKNTASELVDCERAAATLVNELDDVDAGVIKRKTKQLSALERMVIIFRVVDEITAEHLHHTGVPTMSFLELPHFCKDYINTFGVQTAPLPVVLFCNFLAFVIVEKDLSPTQILCKDRLDSFSRYYESRNYQTLVRLMGPVIKRVTDYVQDWFEECAVMTLFNTLYDLLSIHELLHIDPGIVVVSNLVSAVQSPPRMRSIKDWLSSAGNKTNYTPLGYYDRNALDRKTENVTQPTDQAPDFLSPTKRTTECAEWNIDEWEDESHNTPPKKNMRANVEVNSQDAIVPWRGDTDEDDTLQEYRRMCSDSIIFKRWFQELVREYRVRAQQATSRDREAAVTLLDELQQMPTYVNKVKLVCEKQPSWSLAAIRAAVHKAMRVGIGVLGIFLGGPTTVPVSQDVSQLDSMELEFTQQSQDPADRPQATLDSVPDRIAATVPIADEGKQLLVLDAELDPRWVLLPPVWRLGTALFQPQPSLQQGFKNILLIMGGTDNQFLWEDSLKEFISFNERVPRTAKNGLFAYSDIQAASVAGIVCQSCSYISLTLVRARPLLTLANELWHYLRYKEFQLELCAIFVPLSIDAFHSIYRDVDTMYKEFGGSFVGTIDQELRKRLKIIEKDDGETAMHFKVLCDYIDERGITKREELANEIDRLVDRLDVDQVVRAARHVMQTAAGCKVGLVTMLWYNAERMKEMPVLLKNNDGRATFGAANYLFSLLRTELGDDMLDPDVSWTDWDEEYGDQSYRATLRQPQIWKLVMEKCLNAETNLIVVLKENRISPTHFLNLVCDTICDGFRRHRCMVFAGQKVCGKSLCSNCLSDVFMGDRITLDVAGGRDFKVDHFNQNTHGVVVLEDVSKSCCKTYIDKRLRTHIDGDSFTANPKMGSIHGKQTWPPCIITTNWAIDSDSEDEDVDAEQKKDNDRHMAAAGFLQHRYEALKFRTPLYKTGYMIKELAAVDFHKLVWRIGWMPVCNALYGGPQCRFSPCGGRSYGQHHINCRFVTECISASQADIVPNRQEKWNCGRREYIESIDRLKPRHLGRFFNIKHITDLKKSFYWHYRVNKRGGDQVKPECQQLKRVIDNFCDRVMRPACYLSHIMRGDLTVRKDCQWAVKNMLTMDEFVIFSERTRAMHELFQIDGIMRARQELLDVDDMRPACIFTKTFTDIIAALVGQIRTVGAWRAQFQHYCGTARMRALMLMDGDYLSDDDEFDEATLLGSMLDPLWRTVDEGETVMLQHVRRYLSRYDKSKRRNKVALCDRPLLGAWTRHAKAHINKINLLSAIMVDPLSLRAHNESFNLKRQDLGGIFQVFFGIYLLRMPAGAQSKPELMQSADYYA